MTWLLLLQDLFLNATTSRDGVFPALVGLWAHEQINSTEGLMSDLFPSLLQALPAKLTPYLRPIGCVFPDTQPRPLRHWRNLSIGLRVHVRFDSHDHAAAFLRLILSSSVKVCLQGADCRTQMPCLQSVVSHANNLQDSR